MDLKGLHTYNAPVEAVIATLRDPEATVAKYESLDHREVKIIECTLSRGVLRVRSSRVVEVDLPGFAKRVLKPTNTMHQTDEWRKQPDGSWQGTFDIEVKGAPMHISGTMKLTPAGQQCTHEVAIKVDVKVPIVGGRIAGWAAKNDVRRNLDGEFAFNDQWLAQQPAR
jgi:carbon monoxide dehydrogenase subunit G